MGDEGMKEETGAQSKFSGAGLVLGLWIIFLTDD